MKSEKSTSPSERLEHFFRHEYSRLVAVLWRRMGHQGLEMVEDAVQSALLSAVETWPSRGQPAKASAWLFRVAYNRLLDELRGGRRRLQIYINVLVRLFERSLSRTRLWPRLLARR